MISLGKAIYTILSGSTTVNNYVSNKIFPIIAPENTSLPMIIFERSSNLDYSKDGINKYTNNVDIYVLSSGYTDSINISEAVHVALNSYKGNVKGINIIDSRLIDVAEVYQDNYIVQKLTFQIKSF
jgi:hypothetical protein